LLLTPIQDDAARSVDERSFVAGAAMRESCVSGYHRGVLYRKRKYFTQRRNAYRNP